MDDIRPHRLEVSEDHWRVILVAATAFAKLRGLRGREPFPGFQTSSTCLTDRSTGLDLLLYGTATFIVLDSIRAGAYISDMCS